MNNIKNQFDIEKARNGEVVQIFNHVLGDWSLIGSVHWIGIDLNGHVLYQFGNDQDLIRKTPCEKLRMKPKTKTWWFRTWVSSKGIPKVEVAKNLTEFVAVEEYYKLTSGFRWIEEAWSKEISEE